MQRKLKELWKFVEFIFSGIRKMLVTREPETNIILRFVLSQVFISCSASLTVFTLHKKCPYSELFWSAFSRIRIGYGEIRMWKNAEKMRTRITPNTDILRSVYLHPIKVKKRLHVATAAFQVSHLTIKCPIAR